MRVVPPNSSSNCFDIPQVTSTQRCPFSLFVWPLSLNITSGSACSCPAHDSSSGRMQFEDCLSDCEMDYGMELPILPSIHENGTICLSGNDSALNGTIVHFKCSGPCDSVMDNCFLNEIQSMYRIIISGTVTYVGHNFWW